MQTENPEPANLMLRWQTDEETKKLFMIDVSPSDNFYQKQGILCQFPVSNKECYQKSAEGVQKILNLVDSNSLKLLCYSNLQQKLS